MNKTSTKERIRRKVGEVGMKTATINFLPVCSECHQVIWRTIDCIRDDMETHETLKDEMEQKILLPHYTVVPERCPNCGSVFTGINVPIKFPFDNNRVY